MAASALKRLLLSPKSLLSSSSSSASRLFFTTAGKPWPPPGFDTSLPPPSITHLPQPYFAYETEEALNIREDMPGVGKEDVEVLVKPNLLLLRGERKMEAEERRVPDRVWTYGYYYNICEKKYHLTQVKASIRNGVLTVVIPKVKGYVCDHSCENKYRQNKLFQLVYCSELLRPSEYSTIKTEDPDMHFKYIEPAAKSGQIKEVEHVTGELNFCDAEKTKNFFMEAKLPNARPLINVNLVNAPLVVRQLLDDERPEDFIGSLILSVRSLLPVEPLVDGCDKRSGPNLCLPFSVSLTAPNPHT
ncbi:hypothetical protein Vadar_026687 [Vaccinium darrowii]|uniref:Uncharacterized protein n=1 Tax=Vaccinium darrowii TaxID=229202 RepID=A0ACB7XKX7_9ERIC|nr:hypothetical protein Vadar_026687 [Vaccinium darrowii]